MKFALAATFISAVVSAVQAHPQPVAAALQRRTCGYSTTALLRAYNPSVLTDHFYTTNPSEMQAAVAVFAYEQEGTAAQIHSEQTPITSPLYRLFHPAAINHFYTTNTTERDNASGYIEEGIAGYVYETQLCGTVPLFRLFSRSVVDYIYTTDTEERDNAIRNLGYTDEGVAAYVNPRA